MRINFIFCILGLLLLTFNFINVKAYEEISDEAAAAEEAQEKSNEAQTTLDQKDDSYDIHSPPGLTSTCIFPEDLTNDSLYAGKPRNVIVGIQNNLIDSNYVVHYIYGALYHQKSKQQLVQNLTAIKYVKPVASKTASSFEYNIWLHESFAERNFTLVVFAHMTDEKREYIYPVYNQTIRFLEIPENTFDLKFLFLMIVLSTISILISKLIIQKFTKTTKTKKPIFKATKTIKTNEIDFDYIPSELSNKQK